MKRAHCNRQRRYSENLPVKENVECWFGQPIVSGDGAAGHWWGS